ncbi:MAG: 4Fe-4S dicluster domain-containing protein [Thermodesulfobacteriota bacterium]
MSHYYLFQDTKKCIACRACEVVCKINKGLPAGPKPVQIIEVGPRLIGRLPRAAYTFMPCFHCENPWCVAACPTGAMRKRESDGIVYVEEDLCVGCKTCISACPWGAPQWDPRRGKVVKCDYCRERVDQGLAPACVTICLTSCLEFGKPEEMRPLRRRRYAETMAAWGENNQVAPV